MIKFAELKFTYQHSHFEFQTMTFPRFHIWLLWVRDENPGRQGPENRFIEFPLQKSNIDKINVIFLHRNVYQLLLVA